MYVTVPVTSIVHGDHVLINNNVVWVHSVVSSLGHEEQADGFYICYTTSIISSVIEYKRYEFADSIVKVV